MILNHQKFDFSGKSLIEKIVIQAPFKFITNFQNEACFIYFLEGKAKINSAQEQELVEDGESVLLKCGSYFADLLKYSTSEKYEILVFHLYPDILREIYSQEIPSFVKPANDKSFIRKVASSDIIKKFVESLQFYFDNPQLVSDELLRLKIKELMLLLVQSKNSETITSLFSDLFTPRNLSVKEVVSNHLFSNLSISDLANLAQLSVSTFNRTFQDMFNDTPANYIKAKRLERATELLAISSLTISEIAFQTGFNDVAHFSRSFKTAYHKTPSIYRSSLTVA
ncbi:MAG TPA: AraC family transcriptional regulator [Flavipsychrobacter sp.]|nr:AraC family transcriptional regulator [Flavipsychrobacter sp.]